MKKKLDWRFLVIIALLYFVYHCKNNIEAVPQDPVIGLSIDVQVSKEYLEVTPENWQEILKRFDFTLKASEKNQKIIEEMAIDPNRLVFIKEGNIEDNVTIINTTVPATNQTLLILQDEMEKKAEIMLKQGITYERLNRGISKFRGYNFIFIFCLLRVEEVPERYTYMYIIEIPPYSYMIHVNSLDKATIKDAIVSITPKK
ncbi:MAG: hypothetical protein ABII90_02980 [Bacteroidota bacterium]